MHSHMGCRLGILGEAVVPDGVHLRAVGHWPGRASSLLLAKLAPKHSQSSGRFSMGIL